MRGRDELLLSLANGSICLGVTQVFLGYALVDFFNILRNVFLDRAAEVFLSQLDLAVKKSLNLDNLSAGHSLILCLEHDFLGIQTSSQFIC